MQLGWRYSTSAGIVCLLNVVGLPVQLAGPLGMPLEQVCWYSSILYVYVSLRSVSIRMAFLEAC